MTHPRSELNAVIMYKYKLLASVGIAQLGERKDFVL